MASCDSPLTRGAAREGDACGRPRDHRLSDVDPRPRRDGGCRAGAGICAPNHTGGKVPGQGARYARGGPPEGSRRGGLHPPTQVCDGLAGGRPRGLVGRRDRPPPRSNRCYPTEPPPVGGGRVPPMSVLTCPSGHHANKTPRQRQRAGPPSSTWPPCPSEPRGCGRTGRRTGESGTAALERTSSGRTEPPPSSAPRPAASAPASGPS